MRMKMMQARGFAPAWELQTSPLHGLFQCSRPTAAQRPASGSKRGSLVSCLYTNAAAPQATVALRQLERHVSRQKEAKDVDERAKFEYLEEKLESREGQVTKP